MTCGLGIDWGRFGVDLGVRGVDIGHLGIDLRHPGLHRGFAPAIVGLTWGLLRVQNERFGKRVDAE